MPKTPSTRGYYGNSNKSKSHATKNDSVRGYSKPQTHQTQHQYGGKNLKAYNKRRFSIANSTSSSSSQDYLSDDNESDKTRTTNQNNTGSKHVHYVDSDSDSSLTAISDNEFTQSLQNVGKKTRGKKVVVGGGGGKRGKTYGRKAIPRKSLGLSKQDVQNYENEVVEISSGYDDSDEDEVEPSDLVSDVTRTSNGGSGEEEDEDSEDDEQEHVAGLYTLMNNGKQLRADDSDESNQSNDDDGSDEEMFSSSDDDSDVDFVRLQKQQKANATRARKGLKREQKSKGHDGEGLSASVGDDSAAKEERKSNHKEHTKQRKNSIKYGRRKSDVVLPDINFKFEFDNVGNIEEEGDEDDDKKETESKPDNSTKTQPPEEEDVGEEVDYSPTIPLDTNNQQQQQEHQHFEFEFDQDLLHVPKLNDSDLNSDEDYEIDDNELLATLQAENDVDEFLLPQANDSVIETSGEDKSGLNKGHSGVVASTSIDADSESGVATGDDDDDDDDDENDPFLKEEEKFLVNEFENNGFDDNGDDKFDSHGKDANDEYEEDDDDEEEDEFTFDDSEYSTSKRIVNSFKGIGEDRSKPIVQYESSAPSDSDYDEDDYVDFIDFDVPFFDEGDDGRRAKNGTLTSPTKRAKNNNGNKHINSDDDDDDSYLWNYFFSSDNDSSSEVENTLVQYDGRRKRRRSSKGGKLKSTHSNVDELFNEIDRDKTFKIKKPDYNAASKLKSGRDFASRMGGGDATAERYTGPYGDDEDGYDEYEDDEDGAGGGYDSSESTDLDESLPRNTSTSPQIGSKKATEVLSSKTADYRPPMLGSWVTIDSKPFGIIDGMSTRSLQQQPLSNNNNKSQEPRGMMTDGHHSNPHHHQRSLSPASRALPKRKSIGGIRHSSQPQVPVQVGQGQTNSDESSSVLGLDDLLNVSELDNDDENDVRIWRDFNNAQKSRVPLGAFRNKSILHNHHHRQQQQQQRESVHNHHHRHSHHHPHRRNSDMQVQNSGKHNTNAVSHQPQVSGTVKRRKSSLGPVSGLSTGVGSGFTVGIPAAGGATTAANGVVAGGAGAGYRTTKSGLFSEAALASVEEMLGDDYDVMALIERL
ncbi:IFH1 [Candida metapsilosis]|uniref:IFH1 n=1 Tax=Candida metapsilosis TaxID=273372 RepID=A0A8H8D9J3_9ASCO|nr:IFH1 [Candida metapsilosis]